MKLQKSILLSAGIGLCRLWVVPFSLALMPCSHVQAGQITAKADLIMKQKLHDIMIPEFTLSGASFEGAVEKFRQLSPQLDTIESDPAKKGVNIVIKSDSDKDPHAINAVNTSEMKISLIEKRTTNFLNHLYFSILGGFWELDGIGHSPSVSQMRY